MDNSQHIQQLKQRTKALSEKIDATLDKEKLMKLIYESTSCTYGGEYGDEIVQNEIDISDSEIERIADYLIAHGVTFAPESDEVDEEELLRRNFFKMHEEFFGEPPKEE